MQRAINYKCKICGKWFDPETVEHKSAWWRRADGERYSEKLYCSAGCVGRADAKWRLGGSKPKRNRLPQIDNKAASKIRYSADDLPEISAHSVYLIAGDIHLKLPSALVQMEHGATQSEAARRLGLRQSHLSAYISQLRKILRDNDIRP